MAELVRVKVARNNFRPAALVRADTLTSSNVVMVTPRKAAPIWTGMPSGSVLSSQLAGVFQLLSPAPVPHPGRGGPVLQGEQGREEAMAGEAHGRGP